MKGGIYSDEKCHVCQSNFEDKGKNLVCPKHPKISPQTYRVRLKHEGKTTQKRFLSYEEASRFLTGLRFKIDEESFDSRDYQKENPLAFCNALNKYFLYKQKDVAESSFKALKNWLNKAHDFFKDKSVKEINYGDLEDFVKLHLKDISDKSKSNALSAVHDFFTWLKKRQLIELIPDFPNVSFELKFKNLISKEEQLKILDEIYNLTQDFNLKIWLGIKWLSTYIAIRPGELLNIRERDINRSEGLIIIPHPKEKKPKIITLIEEDIEILKEVSQGFPNSFFFCHSRNMGNARIGDKFSKCTLQRYWHKACSNLNIYDVDMYGGTRHSTTVYLGQFFTPEQIKTATMHSTNKAFERYFRISSNQVREIYSQASGKKNNIVIPFKKNK